jgi:hypothetical protein
MIQREPQCVEHSVTFYQYPDENSIKLNTVPPCSLQTVPPGWRRWSSLSPRWVCPVTSKSRRQDHCSLQHFCSFLKLCSLSLLLLLIAFGDITRFERERERGRCARGNSAKSRFGFGSWCRQVVTWSDVRHRFCLFICLQQGDPVKHWPTTAAP